MLLIISLPAVGTTFLLPRDCIAWENNVRWALKQRRYKVAIRCNRAAAENCLNQNLQNY